jgi:hypothetical protein
MFFKIIILKTAYSSKTILSVVVMESDCVSVELRPLTDPLSILQMIQERIWNSGEVIVTEKTEGCYKNIVLKSVPLRVILFIAEFYNTSIINNYFPPQWNITKIIMIPKPDKDHPWPLSYKPISLLNSLRLSCLKKKC